MNTMEILKILVEQIHTTVVATVDENNTPVTCAIDNGYFVSDKCIGCKICYSRCPQKSIDIAVKPVVIDQKHCIRCGNCYEICPARAIIRKG